MIKIICVGKVKESFYREALIEYQKRLSRYTKILLIEVPDIGIGDENVILRKEGEAILNQIGEKDYVITLEIEGKQYDSIALSTHLEQLESYHPSLIWVIGGSYGLSSEVKKRANEKISFSSLTFPHQLFRIILLEQIYRCYRIRYHESYHK